MWFGKSIMTKLALVAAMAVPALAADVEPFHFAHAGSSHDAQQAFWNYMMKYKMFGQEGIEFHGTNIKVPDTSGWFGTATGGFTLLNGEHVVGGHVLIGGNMTFRSGDGKENFKTGPMRVLGNVSVDNWNSPNTINGAVCVKGTVDDKFANDVNSANRYFTGGRGYSNCPTDVNLSGKRDSVPEVKTELTIPTFDASGVVWQDSIGANGDGKVVYLDVPYDENAKKMYDVYIDKIGLHASSRLIVRMQSEGRLTRVFLRRGFYFEDHGRVQIMYMDENAKYENGSWSGSGKMVQNKDYKGDLLFYTTVGFDWPARMPQDTLQGSYITTGLISIKQQMTLAGQLLADTIFVDANFDGSGFIYKQFDPPVVDIKPAAMAGGGFKEDDTDRVIPISLDTTVGYPVGFDYCFDVVANPTGDTVSISDFNKKSDDSKYPEFPICSRGEKGHVSIPANSKTPAENVYLNVKFDKLDEPTEYLKFKIFNLVSAVLPKGNSGVFYLPIENTPLFNFKEVKDHYDIAENSAIGDTVAKIELEGISDADILVSMADNGTEATVKLNQLFNIAIDPAKTFVAITVKNHDELNYESPRIKQAYSITLTLTDNCGTSDCKEKTAKTKINVLDVNEVPTIERIYDPSLTVAAGNFDTLSVKENVAKETTVGIVNAVDPDIYNVIAYGHLDFSIVESGIPFTMKDSVIIVNDASKMNHETKDSVYTFTVKVDNCELATDGSWTKNCLTTSHKVTVKIVNVPEDPEIECFGGDQNCKGPYKALENSKIDSVIHIFKLSDPDIGQLATLKTTVKDNKTNQTSTLFDAKISHDTLSLKVKSKIDYEKVEPYYEVTVTVTDADNKQDTIIRKINIIDVNETPTIDSLARKNDGYTGTAARDKFTLYPKENLKENDPVGIVRTTDPDIYTADFRKMTFSIVETDVPFKMTDSTIVVKDASKMNRETADSVYIFTVKVENCAKDPITGVNACLDTTQKVTVRIQNVPEGPEIKCFENDTICDGPFTVAENSATGTIIHAFQVDDPDLGQIATLKATLTDLSGTGADSLFAVKIVKDSLRVYVKDKSKLNYEAVRDTHKVRLTIKDTDNLGDSIVRVIYIVDVNEAPVFATKDTTIEVKENTPNGTVVGKLPAFDPDTKHVKEFGHLEYFIIGNNIPFTMDSNKIVVTNVDTLDYESLKPDTVFTFKVQVANCEWNKTSGKYDGACLYDTAKVSLAVTDEPEKTVIIPDCKGDSCTECTGPDCHDIVDSLCKGPNCTGVHTHDSVLTLAVEENVPTGYKIIDYLVADEDVGTGHKDSLYAYFKNTNASGADSLFKIYMQKVGGKWRVVVAVKDGSKLDYETVSDIHKLTIYVSDPGDPAGMGDSIRRIIEVVDVNEAPSAKDADLKPEENLPKGTVIGKLDVTEPDTKHVKEFGHLEYSIIGKDSTFAFVMDSNEVKVNDPTKMDYELAVHKYVFDVLISNCELNSTSGKYDGACLYDTAKVTVDIQDVNEKPTIIVDGPVPDGDDDSDTLCVAVCDTTDRGVKSKDSILTVGVRENPENPNGTQKIVTPTGKILFQYHVADEDTNHATGAKVTWFDAGTTIPSVSTKGSDLFTIAYDSVKHVITVRVKDEKLLDYETLRNASSREDPDPEYTMGIVVTDPDGLADTLYRKIRVTDENEKPLFDVWPLVITENNQKDDSLGHVEHPSDIDSMSRNPELYDNGFKMTGGDTALFWLDKDATDLMRVMIRANVVLDCENGDYVCGQDSMYWVYMTYGDTTLKTVYTDLKIPVKLIDLNEPPKILTDTIGVDENSPKGTVVDTIKWDDIDRFDTAMTFKIVNDPIGCFDIDSKTGVVTISANKCSGLDYEKNPTIDLKVSITDMVNIPDSLYDEKCKCQLISAENGPITVTKTVKVNIHDVNEPPSITDKTITVKEDTKPGTVVDTVRATDPDKDPKKRDLTYTLIDGDTTTFKIDPKSGALTLIDSLDYETKNSYYVTVQVDDGEFYDTAKVKINIGNIEEWTTVEITEASSDKKTWEDPETIYTNHAIREICWNQDGYDTCMTNLNIAKDSVVVIKWKNPAKDHAGSDTVRIYFSDAIPEVTVTGKPTLVDAENVFTLVEDMGNDTNIYINTMKDSVWVTIKDPAGKRDTSFAIEVNLDPVTVSQGTLDKVSKIADSKLMRDETGKKVTETPVNANAIKFSYKEIVGQDTVTISYMTDKKGDPIKVPVINDKGKVDSVEVITVTYKTRVGGNNGKDVEVSYQADALTGEIFVKGPSGELMEQGASKTVFANMDKDTSKTFSRYTTNEGLFTITTTTRDALGNDRTISYFVDKKGNKVKSPEGDMGFSVTYTYENKYGNVATESVFIVVDQVLPKVEILSPTNKEIIRSNSVQVVWTVDGVVQDTLTLQGLSKGPNPIIRIYRDKAGNEASATVYVYMKDSKDVDISVEQPVTEISREKIEEYYAINPPEKGETFAVSIRNPTTGEEVETLIGGDFKTKEGSGKEPYPGASGSKHLGPTLAMDIKVPVIDAISGLATLDDLITPDGMIALERTNSKKSHKITVEEYVEEFCEDGFKIGSDASKVNLFDIKLNAKIWVYTSLGNFVDYFSFTQELNDPSFTDDAGLLEMYFEMKPDKDGFVRADNGKQYATGAFVYKVQANIRSKARCTIPDGTYDPDHNKGDGYGETTKRKGDVVKNSDELLKSFGYRRPKNK